MVGNVFGKVLPRESSGNTVECSRMARCVLEHSSESLGLLLGTHCMSEYPSDSSGVHPNTVQQVAGNLVMNAIL